MEKETLYQYIDACAQVRKMEKEIEKLKRSRKDVVQDSVKGSMTEFPYAHTRIHLEGLPAQGRIERMIHILQVRRDTAQKIKTEVEHWLNTLSPRMQRIIQYHVFEGLTWEETAIKMGRAATAESLRKEYHRFMGEKD